MKSYKNWNERDILRLLNSKGIGQNTLAKILSEYDSHNKLLNAEDKLANFAKSCLGEARLFEDKELERTLDSQVASLEKNSIRIVGFWDDSYPVLLKHINPQPPVLFLKGEYENPTVGPISIVGTRRNSTYGKMVVERFVSEFVNSGLTVVSGMAQGIDTIAHEETMKKGGKTVAVLASGLDCIQPSYSKDFAKKIVDCGGAAISSYPPGTKALNQYFIQRNRLISGISKATVVVESKSKGGSLWTARFAQEQGRDVFAVPGKLFSEKSEGTHNLIHSQIAQVAISPEQVLRDMGIEAKSMDNGKQLELDTEERTVYSLLEADGKEFDALLEEAQNAIDIDASRLSVLLLNLEFSGMTRRLAGNMYIRL